MEFLDAIADWIAALWVLVLHMDHHLGQLVGDWGGWAYAIFFLIIFCETGLVVTPFLPGDSFLFALGALAALEQSGLNIYWLFFLLTMAAIMGDTVNYSLGLKFGKKLSEKKSTWWFKKAHLLKTQVFYEKHGGKAIVLARFVPIIRTFAPFVAGMGTMSYRRFIIFNIAGGTAWICIILWSGYFFGNMPAVKANFHLVILGIIGVSLLPLVVEYAKSRLRRKNQSISTGP